jgi:hypothetical protein
MWWDHEVATRRIVRVRLKWREAKLFPFFFPLHPTQAFLSDLKCISRDED